MWRNRSINDTYEPGSIFKVFTASAALEEGVVKEEDTFYCPGYKLVEDRRIRCARTTGHGSETFVQGVQNSCNPVFIEVGMRLGTENFYKYFEKFGLMGKTGVDLPGEAATIMHKKENVGQVELATMSFGQSFQVTPMQMATTVCSLVNGGKRITPHFGIAVYDAESGEKEETISYGKRKRILSKETSEKMRKILETVVSEGGGKKAQIEGYRIGGKTATSLELDGSIAGILHTKNDSVADAVKNEGTEILYGQDDRIKIKSSLIGTSSDYFVTYEGVVKYIQMLQEKDASATAQKWAEQFARTTVCPECKGARLNKEALHFRIHDKNINDLANMDINELYDWLMNVDQFLSDKQKKIAAEILKEIRTRLKFLLDVGLDYLALNRSSVSLSGGESQRIRLATQIGSQLVNVLYILDEPSIGLHQRDNLRLIRSLKELRDMGNSVIVVEHDKDMMLAADYVIDMGPKAGRLGGEVVFSGTPSEMLQTETMTSQYLNGEMKIEVPAKRRKGNGKSIWLKGAKGNNLKNVDVEFPLGKLICVTGVSGSGKSTLINETLQPILSQKFYRSLQDPLEYDSIEGLENIDKVVDVDQSPIGRTPRSNPATYTGVFSDIRNLFVSLPVRRFVMRGRSL